MTLTQINKAGLDEIALDHVFTIGASGTDHYTFQGEGLNGTVNDPTLYLTRGKTYRFENTTGGHPIRIQSTSGASGTAYNTGVTNNASAGTVIVEVQHDAPDVLYYQCTSHANMNGILYITGALADGGVTTAKLADDAVTAAKIGDGEISTAKLANFAVTTGKMASGSVNSTVLAAGSVLTGGIADDAVTGAKIADDAIDSEHYTDGSIDAAHIATSAVTTAKIADGAVTDGKIGAGQISVNKLANGSVHGSKIADQAVTLDKLPHGTSSNDGKFLRANNGADPTFETVSGTTINNNADNRVITGSGTANTLEGEADLTYDGSKLQINDSSISQLVQSYGNNNRFKTLAGSNFLQMITQNDVSLQFRYATDTGSGSEVARVNANGISFSGSNAASESLDDYEEGAFYPQVHTQNGHTNATYHYQQGYYTKIGRIVHASFYIHWSGANNHSGYIYFNNLPFTSANISHNNAIGSVMLHSATFPSGYTDAVLYMGGNSTGTNLYYSKSGSGWAAGVNTTSGEIIASITYTST